MSKLNTIISVDGLEVAYDERVVLRDVSFEIARGEIFGILGGSGCGKSTLMKHMIGLCQPRGGSILIDGEDIVGAEGDKRQAILRKFGVMYQSGALFGSMSVGDNLRLVLEEFTELDGEVMDAICRMKLGLVGLEDFADFMPADLSGGMKKRAAIARAMVLDAGIIFLDEPSAGLDPISSALLDELIVRLSRTLGITFVIVTHELASIFSIADNVIVLDGETKTIADRGEPGHLRDHSENAWVRQFFGRRVEELGINLP
jgi:phospholipid/cholesterol/gamma-HCH transport system ATP-binding protein